jgi:hypothetical protein
MAPDADHPASAATEGVAVAERTASRSRSNAKGLRKRRLAEQVLPIVARLDGTQPRELRFVASDQGTVGFLTLGLDSGNTVSDAHRLASEIEQQIHDQVPEIRELVVDTEP